MSKACTSFYSFTFKANRNVQSGFWGEGNPYRGRIRHTYATALTTRRMSDRCSYKSGRNAFVGPLVIDVIVISSSKKGVKKNRISRTFLGAYNGVRTVEKFARSYSVTVGQRHASVLSFSGIQSSLRPGRSRVITIYTTSAEGITCGYLPHQPPFPCPRRLG